ncbi:hypothetical protein CJF32_00010206 [Rutstroemia sp. NJR-2017a WRK4]|nr:hypothetical protein CJF32_00010206 [Rutstroemia sp. NJR-2017a WRK4]
MASQNPPANAVQFSACFPNWTADSLEQRIGIEAGSRWGLPEIGLFKLLRERRGRALPASLKNYLSEATRRVDESQDIKKVVELLASNWRQHTQSDLLRLAGIFAPFFSLLAEVLEQPDPPDPDRPTRDSANASYAEAVSESSQSSLSSDGSAMHEPPAKRLRETRSGDSYHPSHQSDQSTFERQVKSEFTTNACAFHFLECVTESTRNKDDPKPSFRLEWSLTQDTFTVDTPKSRFSSTNDGNLVYRASSLSGEWTRRTDLSYCSIEAKSHYNLTTNAFSSEGQEGAHMIGMLFQRLANTQQGGKAASDIIPIISARQNMFYIVIGTFPESYHQYLRTGIDTNGLVFGQLDEYGPFDMRKTEDFETMCYICVALVLHLEEICARGQ